MPPTLCPLPPAGLPPTPPIWQHLIRWHEWLNRAEMPLLERQVWEFSYRMPPEAAIAHIRTWRPRGEIRSREASEFWAHHRAMALYALLARPGTFSALERDLGLSPSVLYHLLDDWKIKHITLDRLQRIQAEGHRGVYEGQLSWEGGCYLLRTDDWQVLQVRYTHYDSWVVDDDGGELLQGIHAVRAAALTGSARLKGDLIPLLRVIGAERGMRLLPHPKKIGEWLIPRALLEELFGPETIERVCRELNHCGCAFWSDARLGCGMGHKELTGPRCPDFGGLS